LNALKLIKIGMLTAAMMAFSVPLAGAADITARLIHATNTPAPDKEKGLQEGEPRLAKAFGWREYQLLSKTSSSLREGEIRQLDLGKKLALRVKLLKQQGLTYLVRCQLLRGDEEILQTSVSITSGSAYFITGPEHDNGQLLISIAIR
jgi:hypothetical protein